MHAAWNRGTIEIWWQQRLRRDKTQQPGTTQPDPTTDGSGNDLGMEKPEDQPERRVEHVMNLLPDTGGPRGMLLLGAGVLLIGGGLLARKIIR